MLLHKGLILVFAPLAIELVMLSMLALVLVQLDKESVVESKFRRLSAAGAKLIVLADLAAIDILAWFRINSPALLDSYDQKMELLKAKEKELVELAKSDASESGKSSLELAASIDGLMNLLDQVANLAKNRRLLEMAAVIPDLDKQFGLNKNDYAQGMSGVTSEQQRFAERSAMKLASLRNRQRQILLAGLAANLSLALLLLYFYRKSIVDRLKVVKENTGLLLSQSELKKPLSGVDEIAMLDRSFHDMDRDLKEVTAREKALFQNANDVICVLDVKGVFSRINNACARHWLYEPLELIGASPLALIADSEKESSKLLLRKATESSGQSNFELNLICKDGKLITTLWSSYWSQKEKLLYCVVHDISERKRLEQMKQSYLEMISSDLRIPLASMAEAAEKLSGTLAGSLSEAALQRIQMVRRNLSRLLVLVNDLLEMSSLSSAELKLKKESCQIKDLLERSAHDLEGVAEKKQISFRVESPEISFHGDPHKLMQVIVNLASNAVKFSPENSQVCLAAKLQNDRLEVSVSDKGRGVPESHRKTIFEKFKQVEKSDGKRSSGTGLGLPICKDIIEKHGGEIGVESEEGKGSNFWFRIPVLDPEASNVMLEPEPAVQETDAETAALHPVSSYPALPSLQQEGADAKSGAPLMKLSDSFRLNSITGVNQFLTAPRPPGKARLMRTGVLLIGIPLLIEFVLIASILSIIAQSNESRAEELRQRQIATSAYTILDSHFKFILLGSGRTNEERWYAYLECCRRMRKSRENMAKSLRGDANGLKQFAQVEKYNRKLDPLIDKAFRLDKRRGYHKNNFKETQAERLELIASSAAVAKRLQALIDEAERKEALTPAKQAELRKQQGSLLLLGLLLNVSSSYLLAIFFSKSIRVRLATLADNTRRLAISKPLNEPISGSDEIAELDRYFHETADKLAEARRKERAVFDNSQDLITILDPGYRFLGTNPAAERLLGYSFEELAEKSILDLVDEKHKERLEQMLASEDLGSGKMLEICFLRKDNMPVYLLLSLSRPSLDKSTYCIGHDISARKQLESLKQEFLAVVSHDLRNPLSSVIGFITLIKAGAMGQPGKEAYLLLSEIIDQAQNLLDLINDLLDLEKLEANSMNLDLHEVLAGEVSFRAFESVQAKYPWLELELPESNLEIMLGLDRERLQQAFANIFTFLARQSQPPVTEAKTLLRLEIGKEGPLAVWQITGDWLQIPEDETAVLFSRFRSRSQRLSPDGSNASRGSSLSLPLAKSIIEAHGGNLELASAKGKQGFRITVPIEN